MSHSSIRTYKVTEVEAIRLNLFADFCNAIFKSHSMDMSISIEDIYFDYGQNWWYTSPITYDHTKGGVCSSWQTLCPRDYEVIIRCESLEDMVRYADYYVGAQIDNVDVNIASIA